jgi:hypothetical protein
MTPLRRRLRPFAPAVAALFALCLAAPRAPLLFHHHAGDAHGHTHGDAELLAALADALSRAPASRHAQAHHHHHHHAGAADAHGPAIARPGHAADGHYHEQPRFHRGILPAVPFVAISAPLAASIGAVTVAAPQRAAAAARSRGPPPPPRH